MKLNYLLLLQKNYQQNSAPFKKYNKTYKNIY